MEEAKGVLDESAWIVAFHHWQLSIQRGELTHYFVAYCWPWNERKVKEVNKVVDFVWTSGCGLQRTSQLHKKL